MIRLDTLDATFLLKEHYAKIFLKIKEDCVFVFSSG